MAEIVAELQERLLPEYELLKKFEVCTDEQIRECVRQRENFFYKITQSQKSMQNYLDFILFERKVHEWVTEKEKLHGTKMAGLKASIVKRIISLYREGCGKYPHKLDFWEKFIQFSEKSLPHEVAGIYEKMLNFHGNNTRIWSMSALWIYQYTRNMPKVKEIFFRGLQRHPESWRINKTFFDILLLDASNMSAERNLADNTVSEQDKGLECVELIYRSSIKNISDVAYFLQLLQRCEEDKYADLTAPLQRTIINDMKRLFPHSELLWDALAQRELRGFSMSDLINLQPTLLATTDNNSNENIVNAKEEQSLIWRKRTQKTRIEFACNVYQMAVNALKTSQMWTLYINAMLELNLDVSTQQVLKRKRLAIAFKEGHESGLMSIEHYCLYARMLNKTEMVESVLSTAVQIHKSVRIYEVYQMTYVVANNEPRVLEIFRRANAELGTLVAFPLWRQTLQFYKTRQDDCAKTLQKLYKEASEQMHHEFGVFRGEYLEFCKQNMSMKKTRAVYDELCKLPPPSLELHQAMAMIESQLLVHTKADLSRWRMCHENAAYYFGKTNSKVWIDFIKFEREHGDRSQTSTLYQRAKHTLEPKLSDNFISEYTLQVTLNNYNN